MGLDVGGCQSWIPPTSRTILTFNEPVDYMAWAVMILMRGKDITWAIGRVGPRKSGLFWELKQLELSKSCLGPMKLRLSWPNPSNGPSNGFSRIKNIPSGPYQSEVHR